MFHVDGNWLLTYAAVGSQMIRPLLIGATGAPTEIPVTSNPRINDVAVFVSYGHLHTVIDWQIYIDDDVVTDNK